MHPTLNTVSLVAIASTIAAPSFAMQLPPAAPPGAVPPTLPVALVSAPAPGNPAVALAPTTETAVLSAPVPTISPSWGYRCAVIGDTIVASGAERAVAPGPINTHFAGGDMTSPEAMAFMGQRLLVPRVGEPEDVANLVSFLLSDQASFIDGVQIPIDGGWLTR